MTHGVPAEKTDLIYENASLNRFQALCEQSWAKNRAVVEQAQALQKKRNNHLPGMTS